MGESIHSKEYQEIIRKLRSVRLTTKLTQTEVARKLNKPQSYISKIERGERRIDVVELKMILKIYKVALTDFF